jgi:hypothetical protein
MSRSVTLLVVRPLIRHSRREKEYSTDLLLVDISWPFLTFHLHTLLLLPNSDILLCFGLGSGHIYPPTTHLEEHACLKDSTPLHPYKMSAMPSPALSFCDTLSSPDLDAYLDSLPPLSHLPSPTMKEAWWREESLAEKQDSFMSDISSPCTSSEDMNPSGTRAHSFHRSNQRKDTLQHHSMRQLQCHQVITINGHSFSDKLTPTHGDGRSGLQHSFSTSRCCYSLLA